MATYQVPNTNISLLDALWTLFKSQPKAVRNAFVHRLHEEEKSSTNESQTNVRKARVVHKPYKYTDQELEKLLKSNPDIPDIPEADVKSIITGNSGKALNNFKHWM